MGRTYPAAHDGGEAKPQTRLWYRVFATISISRTGDFDRGPYVDHRATMLRLRLRSRTAALLYRQCTPLNDPSGRLNGKDLQTLLDLPRSSFTCQELRAALRDNGFGDRSIRRLRLTDDARFDANGQGFVDAFERWIDQPEHVETLPGGAVVACPTQTLEISRTTGPERIGGRLSTQSAVRDGIDVAVRFPLRLAHEVESGSEGPCILRATGAPVRTRRLVRGFGAGSVLFGTQAQYGPVPTPTPIRTRLAGRFGASFRVSQGRESVERQPDGAWRTRVLTTVTFSLCPHGGRDASGC